MKIKKVQFLPEGKKHLFGNPARKPLIGHAFTANEELSIELDGNFLKFGYQDEFYLIPASSAWCIVAVEEKPIEQEKIEKPKKTKK